MVLMFGSLVLAMVLAFHSSKKIEGEKLKQLEKIAEDIALGLDPYGEDWF